MTEFKKVFEDFMKLDLISYVDFGYKSSNIFLSHKDFQLKKELINTSIKIVLNEEDKISVKINFNSELVDNLIGKVKGILYNSFKNAVISVIIISDYRVQYTQKDIDMLNERINFFQLEIYEDVIKRLQKDLERMICINSYTPSFNEVEKYSLKQQLANKMHIIIPEENPSKQKKKKQRTKNENFPGGFPMNPDSIFNDIGSRIMGVSILPINYENSSEEDELKNNQHPYENMLSKELVETFRKNMESFLNDNRNVVSQKNNTSNKLDILNKLAKIKFFDEFKDDVDIYLALSNISVLVIGEEINGNRVKCTISVNLDELETLLMPYVKTVEEIHTIIFNEFRSFIESEEIEMGELEIKLEDNIFIIFDNIISSIIAHFVDSDKEKTGIEIVKRSCYDSELRDKINENIASILIDPDEDNL